MSRMPNLASGPCRLCGAPGSAFWGRENGFDSFRCRACDLVFIDPWPDLSRREEAVSLGVHEGEQVLNSTNSYLGERARAVYRTNLDTIYGPGFLAGLDVRWLDVGCGFGEFVEAIGEHLGPGSTVSGVEPNVHKRKAAQERGLDVQWFDLTESDDRWDRISLMNVLSHIPDPGSFVRSLRDHLVPGGELLLQTGNGGAVPRREFPGKLNFPDHLLFFSRPSLQRLFEEAGLRLVSCHGFPSPPFSLDSLARDLAKIVIRPGHNRIRWRGGYRSLWLRGVRVED